MESAIPKAALLLERLSVSSLLDLAEAYGLDLDRAAADRAELERVLLAHPELCEREILEDLLDDRELHELAISLGLDPAGADREGLIVDLQALLNPGAVVPPTPLPVRRATRLDRAVGLLLAILTTTGAATTVWAHTGYLRFGHSREGELVKWAGPSLLVWTALVGVAYALMRVVPRPNSIDGEVMLVLLAGLPLVVSAGALLDLAGVGFSPDLTGWPETTGLVSRDVFACGALALGTFLGLFALRRLHGPEHGLETATTSAPDLGP